MTFSSKNVILFFVKWMLLQLPLLFFASHINASHIVGGDFELKHLVENKYSLGFNLYFDKANANPGAKDPFITAAIYSKSNNSLVEWFDLPLLKDVDLNYLNPECSGSPWEVELLVYQKDISFQLEKYKDTLGYYVVWERCCRNGSIINLVNSGETGASFLLEFPSLFYTVNSTPHFKPVAARVACVFNPFQTDFGAIDDDGDSLVYELVTPTQGSSSKSNPSPFPQPSPYRLVTWYNNFSLQKITSGDLPLTINSSNGVISFNSNLRGIFAFAVACYEYRKGKQISKAVREYQLPITACKPNAKPNVFFIDKIDSLNGTAGKTICKQIGIVDDSNSIIKISAIFANSALSKSATLSSSELIIDHDSGTVTLCIDSCASPTSEKSMIMVKDNSCPSLSDSLEFIINIIDTVKTPFHFILNPAVKEVTLLPDESFSWVISIAKSSKIIDLSISTNREVSPNFSIERIETKANIEEWKISVKANCKNGDIFNAIPIRIVASSCFNTYNQSFDLSVKIVNTPISPDLIPNIFTPNGDGTNDYFPVIKFKSTSCDDSFHELKVYNRWGAQVFTTEKLDENWNANNVPDGVYFYHAQYDKSSIKGYVQVLR